MTQNPLKAWYRKKTIQPYKNWILQHVERSTLSTALHESLDNDISIEWIHDAVKDALLHVSTSWNINDPNPWNRLCKSEFVQAFNAWFGIRLPNENFAHLLVNDSGWNMLCQRAMSLKKDHERPTAWLLLQVMQHTNDRDSPVWSTALHRTYGIWEYKHKTLNTISDNQLDIFLTDFMSKISNDIKLSLAVHCWIQGRIHALQHPIFAHINRDDIYTKIFQKHGDARKLLPSNIEEFHSLNNKLHILVWLRTLCAGRDTEQQTVGLWENSLSEQERAVYHLLPEPSKKMSALDLRNAVLPQWSLIDECNTSIAPELTLDEDPSIK